MPINIFISYSQEDFRTDGRKLYNYLGGHIPDSHVFIDQSKTIGQKWRNKNDQELALSHIVVVVLTPAAKDSQEVYREIDIAKKQQKRIIPCVERYTGDWKDLPWELGNYEGVIFDNFEHLMRELFNEIIKIRKEILQEPTDENYLESVEDTFEFDSTIPFLVNGLLVHIPYRVQKGTVALVNPFLDNQINSINFTVYCENDAEVTLILDRNIIDAKKGKQDDDVYIVLSNGKEIEFKEDIQKNYRSLTFSLTASIQTLEIIGTQIIPLSDDDKEPDHIVKILEGSSSPKDDKNYLEPETITVNEGDKIRWKNTDSAAHTITSGSPGAPDGFFDSNLFLPKIHFDLICNKKGTYLYYCTVHPWKTGKIIVK